ncbi:hypothetical protein MRX96_017255 [Rhipicephalus microplus]
MEMSAARLSYNLMTVYLTETTASATALPDICSGSDVLMQPPYYSSLLKDTMFTYAVDEPFPDGYFIFQQEKSPVLMGRHVTAMLEDLGVRTLPWLPCGADANPIENVRTRMNWGLSRRNLSRATSDAVWKAIQENWEALRSDGDYFTSLGESMPRTGIAKAAQFFAEQIPDHACHRNSLFRGNNDGPPSIISLALCSVVDLETFAAADVRECFARAV